ncbi:heparinase II/III family protein [Litorimonas haliclonae]|uniref:heparinase II/III family protein n=1 Tax=Litorimonas haliclonae TaxID=2081977 RepID=UPI0039F10FDC
MEDTKTRPDKATIVAFGNKSNQKLETALRDFAKDVDPSLNLRKLHDIISRITPEEYRYDWAGTDSESRSEKYRRNAWLNFTPIFYSTLTEYKNEEDSRTIPYDDLLKFCGAWMVQWHVVFPFNPEDPTGGNIANKFAWYDMAVGMRAAILSQILFYTHRKILPNQMVESLLSCAREHLTALRLPDTWAAHSNHGFFQSAGLFALSVQTPDISENSEADRKLASQRLRQYLESTFSEDGVHLEHSCEYHNFMFKSLSEIAPLLNASNDDERWIADLFERMQDAMSAMILPNRLVAPFGDGRYTTSESTIPKNPEVLNVLKPSLKSDFVKTQSTEDIEPLLSFPRGGFCSYKKRRREFDDSYLAVSAWHHSIIHKHVDELSPIWAENSVPILSDAGRYGYEGKTEDASKLRQEGYFYSDPKRVFVESAHAHNTVEIDGKSDNRRLALPYQSGLAASAKLNDGTVVIDTEIVREPLVRHQRLFIYSPSKSLVIIDELTDERWVAGDKPKQGFKKISKLFSRKSEEQNESPLPPRTYTQWHQFFPAWQVEADKSGISARFNQDWLAKYFDHSPKSKPRLLSENTIPPASYSVRAAVAAWTEEKKCHVPEVKLHHGDVDNAGRYTGWASLWPLTLKPSAAISQTITTQSKTALFASFFEIRENGSLEASVDHLEIEALPGGVRKLQYECGDDSKVIEFRRSKKGLELSFGDGSAYKISRTLVDRNYDAQALYKARAAIKGLAPTSEIFDLFKTASANGWGQAINEAAEYARSIGDDETHFKMASLAQESGDGVEALKLAQIHLNATNAAYDLSKAYSLLNYAVEQNVRAAHFYLGNLYLDKSFEGHDLAKAKNEFRKGAMRDHIGSMVQYSDILAEELNYVEAVKWLTSAAEGGSSEAHMRLGNLYCSKVQAPEYFDMTLAAKHYEKAGLAGSKVGAYEGAKIFMNPDIDVYDLDRAVVLLKIAADLGSEVAKGKLEKLRHSNSSA